MQTLKDRFILAINNGELGHKSEYGVTFTKKEFAAYFSDVTERYTCAFLPAATIEAGSTRASHTKYLYRVERGVYRVHKDVLDTRPTRGEADRLLYRFINGRALPFQKPRSLIRATGRVLSVSTHKNN